MQSRARILIILIAAVAVPMLAIWQRWSEIRVFARELTMALNQSAVAGGRSTPQTGEGKRLSGALPTTTLAAGDNWQGAIDKVLKQKTEPAAMAAAMLDLLPAIPMEGRAEAVQHIANLLPDENYGPVSRLLVNPETPADIQDLLLMDLLNRRNALKLPVLLEVARTPEHARAQQAKDLLQPYVVEDYGGDWAKCQEKIALWLKENPDS